jgi:succinate dehydrogenase / fumarate reductase flavoprotein subunit
MLDYDPERQELSARDVVARSIYKEVLAGRGTEHGGVFLDVSHLGAAAVRKKLPSMVEQFHALAGVDITREPMEVAPTIHYTMGGVKVDPETAATSVAGLYAAGEVAAGVHGANRLGGNSLGDILVFGKRAGDAAAQYVRQVSHGRLPQDQIAQEEQALLKPLQDGEGENPYALHRELQNTMQAGAAIARTATSLQQALEGVASLRERSRDIRVRCGRHFNPSWHAVADLRAMLTVSEAIIRAGQERKESRGSQWRLDHPDLDSAQGRQNWLAYRGPDGSMRLRTEPVPPLPERLAKLLVEKK